VRRMPRVLRWGLPFVVSGGVLAFLLARLDARAVLERITADVWLLLVPALLAHAALSLALDAASLRRLAAAAAAPLPLSTCARIRAASYPLALLHYGLGAATLTILLRRRGGLPVAAAAGAVLLLALLDLGVLLVLTAAGAALLASSAPALRAGVVAGAAAAMLGGLALLRAPVRMGPLDRLRALAFLAPARTAPPRVLAHLVLLRLLFVVAFVALVGAALLAFDVRVPVGDLIVGVAAVSLVAALPIAFSGIGTGQAAFVFVFRPFAEPETLLACSLALSAGILLLRAGIGLAFAGEFAREALHAAREVQA
jgi:hypothetical protein